MGCSSTKRHSRATPLNDTDIDFLYLGRYSLGSNPSVSVLPLRNCVWNPMSSLRHDASMDARETYLYHALAGRLSQAIRAGSLKAGDRLPSVRQLSQQHQVSIATAVQAYRWLENQRLIEARPKSGYFVISRGRRLELPNVSSPPLSASFVGINHVVMEYLQCSELPDVVPLGC